LGAGITGMTHHTWLKRKNIPALGRPWVWSLAQTKNPTSSGPEILHTPDFSTAPCCWPSAHSTQILAWMICRNPGESLWLQAQSTIFTSTRRT
jgi:hypothetical protein